MAESSILTAHKKMQEKPGSSIVAAHEAFQKQQAGQANVYPTGTRTYVEDGITYHENPAGLPEGGTKYVGKPDIVLSPWEKVVHGIDQAGQFLDRIHAGTNAAANKLGEGMHFASTAEIHQPNPPDNRSALDVIQAIPRGIQRAGERIAGAAQAGMDTYRAGKKEPFRAFSNLLPSGSATTEQLLMRAMDLSSDIQTDPVAMAQALGVGAVAKGVKLAAPHIRQIKAVEQGLARANAMVDPLAKSLSESRAGAWTTRILGNLGGGPHQRLRREMIRPYDLEVTNNLRPSQEVIAEVQRETLRLRKTGFDQTISDYALQNGEANPVDQMLQNVIRSRIAAAGMGKATPFNQLTPRQKGAMVKQCANPFGISPTWLIDQADKVIDSMNATEYSLLKAGVKPVFRQGTGNRALDVDEWLDTMFGKPIKGATTSLATARPSTPGALVRGTAQIPQVREAGIRNFIDKLPQNAEWVKPLNVNGVADPGWQAIPQAGILGSKLSGMQVPAPLKAFLDTELAAGGMAVSNEPKSWYIQNKDWIEWLGKNVVGTVKKSLIAATSTQTANLFSNNLVSVAALKSKGINPKRLTGAIMQQAGQDVLRLDKGKAVAQDIQEIRKYSNSFDATEKATSFFGGVARPATEGTIVGEGTRFAYREPTFGETAHALYPPNHLTDFQGVAERTYKLATYRVLREAGIPPPEAAATVERYLFDYSDRGPMLEIADKFGFWPFATYPTKAFGLLMHEMVNHPENLVRYPRLRELAFRGYETNLQNTDPRYVTAFTFPYGNPEDKKLVDVQRAVPLGAGVEGLTDLAQGKGVGEALTSAVGLGRGGDSPLESVINAPLFGRAYGIAAGISPFGEAGKPKGMLQPGQPPSDLAAMQVEEARKSWLPSQLGGRATIAARDLTEGKTATDAPFTTAKTGEEVGLQYLVGVRTFNAKTPTDKKKDKTIKAEVKSRASEEVKSFLKTAKEKAMTTAPPQDIQKDAQRLTDPGQLKREIVDAKTRLKNLPISGRVSVKGKLTDEGRSDLQRQLFYIYALKARLKEVARGQ